MKRLIVLTATLLLAVTAVPASGADLVGVWSLTADCVLAGGGPAPGALPRLRIEGQSASGLFWGYAGDDPDGADPPNTDLSGAVIDKDVYMTFWDATVRAELLRGGKEMLFVAQIQDAVTRSSHTCIGIATKQ